MPPTSAIGCRRGASGAGGCIVVGDVGALRRGSAVAGTGGVVATIEHAADLATVPPGAVPVLPVAAVGPDLDRLPHGRIDARAGAAAAAFIRAAVELAR